VQLVDFATESAGGFLDVESAARLALALRDNSPSRNNHERWVVIEGSDDRFYVYQALAVAQQTSPMQTASPAAVMGPTFLQYVDPNRGGWVAVDR
jgi:hypothetical protein